LGVHDLALIKFIHLYLGKIIKGTQENLIFRDELLLREGLEETGDFASDFLFENNFFQSDGLSEIQFVSGTH
jgi:hypothetical protein